MAKRRLISKRLDLLDSSGIRKVFELASQIKNPIDLSIGQPDFDALDEVKEEAIYYIQGGFNRYTVTQGIPELRLKILSYYKRLYGVTLEDVLITSGVSGALFLAFLALIEEGDEFIIPDPYFVIYKHVIRLLGGVPKYLDTYPDFHIDPERLASLVGPKTKAIVINSPCNPTGKVMSQEEMKGLAEVAGKHELLVISDEIYERFTYDEAPDSFTRYYPHCLVLNGFSKSGAIPGWRVGYAGGPKELIAEMSKLQQYSFVCAPSFAQKAAMVALDSDISHHINAYRAKRDLLYHGLCEHFEVVKPEGAFYIFPKAPHGDGQAFAEEAIRHNLLLIPGNIFSERNTHFRLSFAQSDETLRQALEVLQRLAQNSLRA